MGTPFFCHWYVCAKLLVAVTLRLSSSPSHKDLLVRLDKIGAEFKVIQNTVEYLSSGSIIPKTEGLPQILSTKALKHIA